METIANDTGLRAYYKCKSLITSIMIRLLTNDLKSICSYKLKGIFHCMFPSLPAHLTDKR